MKKNLWRKMITIALLLFTCSLWSAAASAATIPSDAVIWNGHAYKLYNKYMTWEKAQAACKKAGGHLVTITSASEQRFVEKLVKSKASRYIYWIGASHKGANADWRWVTGEKFKYTNWTPGEPDYWQGIANDDYAAVTNIDDTKWTDPKYTWKDMTNIGYISNDDSGYWKYSNQFGYICEWDSTKISIAKASVKLSKTSYVYNGTNRNPGVSVKLNGKNLTKDKDYTLTYIANKFPGYGHVKIVGKGKYTGTVKAYFSIKPKQITGVTVTKPASKQLKVSWKKASYVTGYQVQYAAAFKKTKTVKLASNVSSVKLTKLSKGTTYAIRVRAYATNNGKTAYGAWSKLKNVKVK